MKILLIGSGGREHALARSISTSSKCDGLFIAPGNAGTETLGTNVSLNTSDHEAVLDLVKAQSVDLVVVGPEQPLVEGIADFLESRGVSVVGPNKMAAQLEGSKDFSKQFMQKYGIPTAAYRSFRSHELDEAKAYISAHSLPIVVKASGLAAGKGVLICETHEAALNGAEEMLSGVAFGDSGTTIVVEEFLSGIEVSVFVLTDGTSWKLLPEAKDYKRIGEGDIGLNTGGMGAVSPVEFADAEFMDKVGTKIIVPTISGLKEEGITYKGFIFIGLIKVGDEPFVIEYNVRLGDPETEVILPRISSDLVDLLEGVVQNDLANRTLEISEQACCTVMVVSGGYPGKYEKGKHIAGLELMDKAFAIHAGTRREEGEVLTNGGRVLAITALGDSVEEALRYCYDDISKLCFEGMYFRRDIGQDVVGE